MFCISSRGQVKPSLFFARPGWLVMFSISSFVYLKIFFGEETASSELVEASSSLSFSLAALSSSTADLMWSSAMSESNFASSTFSSGPSCSPTVLAMLSLPWGTTSPAPQWAGAFSLEEDDVLAFSASSSSAWPVPSVGCAATSSECTASCTGADAGWSQAVEASISGASKAASTNPLVVDFSGSGTTKAEASSTHGLHEPSSFSAKLLVSPLTAGDSEVAIVDTLCAEAPMPAFAAPTVRAVFAG
jgi:hypothetical protein